MATLKLSCAVWNVSWMVVIIKWQVKQNYIFKKLWTLFKLLGLFVEAERHTINERMDVLMQTKD